MNEESENLIHLLRTPIYRIEGLAKQALHLSCAGRDTREHIERIFHQTRRVRGLLSLFRFTSALATDQKLHLHLREIAIDEIGDIMERTLADFSCTDGHRNISHELSLHPGVRGHSAVADHEALEQAFYVVLDNAFRYAYRDSRVTVTIRNQPSQTIEIAVRNKGLRLCSADIPNIFVRGWRSPVAVATTADGSGLGLWLARSLIDAMDGTLSILPTDEQEITTAVIRLPLAS